MRERGRGGQGVKKGSRPAGKKGRGAHRDYGWPSWSRRFFLVGRCFCVSPRSLFFFSRARALSDAGKKSAAWCLLLRLLLLL